MNDLLQIQAEDEARITGRPVDPLATRVGQIIRSTAGKVEQDQAQRQPSGPVEHRKWERAAAEKIIELVRSA